MTQPKRSPSRSQTSASAARLAAWRRLTGLGTRPSGSSDEPSGEEMLRRDRAQANRLVHGVLRRLSLIDALLDRERLFDPAKTPAALRWVLRMAVYEKIFQAGIPDYAIGEQAVELARQAGGAPAGRFANAVMRRLLPRLPASPEALAADPIMADLPDTMRWSIPPAIITALAEGYGQDEARAVLQALAEREAAVWLRVNTLKATPPQVVASLAEEAIETATDPAAPPEALRWSAGAALPWSAAAWKRGELTVQDVGAMLAAHLLAPPPGAAVVDACAAPGGKTGQLWELMEGHGRLVALDVTPERRREMRQALERLYGAGHGIEIPDADDAIRALPEAAFDRVLVDAPCQALGLIRRHPEVRWDDRLRHQAAMRATQAVILRDAARLVRPGGRLLWVTCSPTAAENEEIIIPWLEENKGWWIRDPRELLRPEWLGWVQVDKGVLRTRPDRMDCDGFAMILLERLE